MEFRKTGKGHCRLSKNNKKNLCEFFCENNVTENKIEDKQKVSNIIYDINSKLEKLCEYIKNE